MRQPSRGSHHEAVQRLRNSVLDCPGVLSPEIRHLICDGNPIDPPLGPFLDKVRQDSPRLTASDIDHLRQQGLSEDEILEATMAAALGVADRILQAGLRALGRD